MSNDIRNLVRDGDVRTTIATPAFCEECGYNLYSLPERGRCPECGNDYRAGGLNPSGIFFPTTAPFPLDDLMLAVAAVTGLAIMVHGLTFGFELWTFVLTVALLITVPKFLRLTWRSIRRFLIGQRVAARIRRELDDC